MKFVLLGAGVGALFAVAWWWARKPIDGVSSAWLRDRKYDRTGY